MFESEFSKKELGEWRDKEFFLEGDSSVGVILIHGWSSIPRQVLPIAEHLNKDGFSVKGLCLSGHGTKPEDLETVKSEHWVDDLCRAVDRMRNRKNISKVIVGGISMGGNLAMIASEKKQIDGMIFMGTPVFLKNHFGVWLSSKIIPLFSSYLKKKYPKGVPKSYLTNTSYQYYPTCSAVESIKIIRHSLKFLRKIHQPVLILQTSKDYLVSKVSPWILYNAIPSTRKKLQLIKTKFDSHVLEGDEAEDSLSVILNFVRDVENN